MGIASSSAVGVEAPFQNIISWPWTKVVAVLREHADGDFDFGVDCSVIMGVTGMDVEEARTIVNTLCKNETGLVNSVVFLSSIILFGDGATRNVTARLEALFSIVDFNNANQISVDELAILLLGLSTAITSVLKKPVGTTPTPTPAPTDTQIIRLAALLNENKGRKATSSIYKHEFVAYASQLLSAIPGGNVDVVSVLQLLNGTLDSNKREAAAAAAAAAAEAKA